jgi:hypothetical protein
MNGTHHSESARHEKVALLAKPRSFGNAVL